MIQFSQVTKRYPGGHTALESITLGIEKGELVFLTGHSGAGKSTLLKLIAAIERPTSGAVTVNGQNIGRLSRHTVPFLRRNIGLIFQDHKLLFDRNVIENTLLPLSIAGFDRREALKRARAALDKVGLLNRERALPVALSGGEQQRLCIARAVVSRPALVLADEPTGNLDAGYAIDILSMFKDFHRVGTTLVISTHDERADPGHGRTRRSTRPWQAGGSGMSNWLAHHFSSLVDALRRFLRTPFAAGFTALAVGVAITLPVGMYLAVINLNHLAGDLPAQPEISLFLADNASQGERAAIRQKLEAHPSIDRRRFVSRDDALERLNAQGLADLTAGLDRNPLPDAWVLTPKLSSPREMEALRKELSALPGVESVQADSVWAERLQALLGIGRQIVLLLTTLFGLALIAIASNAIRAQILARREEIEVSRLIGATDRYIRRPFLYYGALQGATGALAALGILALLGLALDAPVSQLATLYGSPFRLVPLGIVEVGMVLGVATLFSWLGAWVAVTRTLRKFD